MSKQSSSFWLTPNGIGAMGLIAAVSYFLFMEHRQHLFQFLPFLILLLCPLMHIFMHGGHGHGSGGHGGHDQAEHDAFQRGLEEGKKQAQNHNNH
mgnify:CR=1 FL=1